MSSETVKPMPQAQAAGNMSRTRSPLGMLSPPGWVDSHAVAMMPNGLPTTRAATMPMTTGEVSSAGLSVSKCTPAANSAKTGSATSDESGWSLTQ